MPSSGVSECAVVPQNSVATATNKYFSLIIVQPLSVLYNTLPSVRLHLYLKGAVRVYFGMGITKVHLIKYHTARAQKYRTFVSMIKTLS